MPVISKVFAMAFTKDGSPALGLAPTITIRRADVPALEVSAAAMSEVGDGWYAYTWPSFNTEREYVATFDGGPSLSEGERYGFAASVCDEGDGGSAAVPEGRAEILVNVQAPPSITIQGPQRDPVLVSLVTDAILGAAVDSPPGVLVHVQEEPPPTILVSLKECP